MPIPKPKPNEGKDDFISRCMSAIGDEYDDKDQALAICFDAWKNKGAGEEMVIRTIDCEIRQVGSPEDRTLEFIGSDETKDSYGDVIEVAGWELGRYEKNPVFLWAHDYNNPPIGRAVQVMKGDGLRFHIQFAPKEVYEFADTIYKLYQHGFMRATSVGFFPREKERIEDDEGRITGWRIKRQELLELSAVPVPANPNALIQAVQRGIVSARDVEDLMEVPFEEGLIEEARVAHDRALAAAMARQKTENRGVIPFHAYPKAPEDAEWDAGAEVKAAEVKDLKKMCAWFAEDGSKKGHYKLPHHKADGYATVWRGVAAAMGALLGARGGVQIPGSDKRGVYNHLAKHYRQFDKEPPKLKDYSLADLERISLGLEPLGGSELELLQEIKGALEALAEDVRTLSGHYQDTVRTLFGHERGEPVEDVYSLALDPGFRPSDPEGAQRELLDDLRTLLTQPHLKNLRQIAAAQRARLKE